MRILVYGAGAVGCYLGGRLAKSGHDVTLIARQVTAEAINTHGLYVTEKKRTIHSHPQAVMSALQAFKDGAEYDCLIMGMKSYDLRPSLDPLIAFCPQPPPIITVQNGIGVEKPLIDQFGPAGVIAGVVTIPITKETANTIVVEKDGRGLCLAPIEKKQNIKQWVKLFSQAGISTSRLADYQAMKWSKAFLNLIGNATSAILNRPPVLVYKSDLMFDLEMRMLREALEVMKALNIKLVDLPGSATNRLAFSLRRLPTGLLKPVLGNILAGVRGDKMPSFHIDLMAGKGKSEVIYHNGAIARAGQKCNVATPVNAALADILLKLAREQIDWRLFDGRPKRLLVEVKKYE